MISTIPRNYFEQLSKHWGVIAALITLLTSMVGMISAREYYSFFHVNYLELAELNDFIKHLISRPYLAYISLTVVIVLPAHIYIINIIYNIEINLKKSYANLGVGNIKLKKNFKIKQFSTLAITHIIVTVITYHILSFIKNSELERLKSTEYELFNVATDTKPLICARYIGRININNIFLERKNSVIIIPSSSIKRWEYVASLGDRPKEFVADNQLKTSEYIKWQNNIKEICGKEFEIPAIR